MVKRLPPIEELALIEVYWNDAGDHAGGWKHVSEVEPAVFEQRTAGYFIRRKRGLLLMAGTITPSDRETNSISEIPIGCITRIRVLPVE